MLNCVTTLPWLLQMMLKNDINFLLDRVLIEFPEAKMKENEMANRQEYNYYKEIIKILTKSKNMLMVLNVGESWFK